MSKKGSKREHKMLSIMSKVNAAAIKIYDEQLVDGVDAMIDAIEKCDKEDIYVLAIRHDRDEQTDGIWAVSIEKPHYHIIVKYRNRLKKERVKAILDMLHIQFRQGLDDLLLKNHGIESIGSFTGYAMYLTHETDDAIADNKEIYKISEIISNLDEEEIKCIRAGYLSIDNVSEKVTMSKLAKLDKQAFDLGYAMGNFTDWYKNLPFSVRSSSKMKTIKESYDMGVQVKLEEGSEINRLCIYIQGASNTGKTYAVKQALKDKRILAVGGGGTGKFDRLRPDHEVIVIDDDICPNVLNMCDNYMCYAYRRQSQNPVWSGKYFVVTSNLLFEEWLRACGVNSLEHISAATTRFFICSIEQKNGISRLALASPSTRGSADEQIERTKKFAKFQHDFNQIIAKYKPDENRVNFDSLIDEIYAQYAIDAPDNLDYLGNHIEEQMCYAEWKKEQGYNTVPQNEYEENYLYILYNDWLNWQKSLKNELEEVKDYIKLKSTYPVIPRGERRQEL